MALTSQQVPHDLETVGEVPGTAHWPPRRRARRWRKYVPIALGMTMIVLMGVVALLAPVLAPFSPSTPSSEYVLQGPGAGGHHLLGTDEYGRDLLSRIIWGTRVSLQVGLASVLVGFCLGVPCGILAGFLGGATETTIMRLTDI